MQREEALEVAMLAKSVGSHLLGVDQLTVERSNSGGPANKINMQNFIAPLVGKQQAPQHHEYGANPDMVKAYQGLNELALQSIPDVVSPAAPVPLPNTSVQQPNSNIHAGSPIAVQFPIQQPPQVRVETKENISSVFTRSDVDSIRNSLKGIDKSLAALVNYMKNTKK